MKITTSMLSALIVAGTLSASVALAAPASMPAQANNVLAQQGGTIELNTNAQAALPVKALENAKGENKTAASTSAKVEKDDQGKGGENAKDNDSDKNTTSNEHKSVVALFVQNLLSIANRDGGIGSQVKAIAQAQNDAEKEISDAIVKVENRGAFKTFFAGTDYKNIGVIRSSMAKSERQIEALKELADLATSSTVKAELQVQIDALEEAQADIDAFIKANESKFSLFGWLAKK